MIISHIKKFIFVHNPKCAGTAFREVLEEHHDHPRQFWGICHDSYFQRDMDYAHLRLWELAALHPELMALFEDYTSMAFVRNPFSRFLSAIGEHFKQYRHDEQFEDLPRHARLEAAEAFISNDLTLSRIETDFRYVHFSPQSWFLNLGDTRKVKHILPIRSGGHLDSHGLELLGLPAAPLKPRNVRTSNLSSLLQSNVVRAFVIDFYRQDFRLFHGDNSLHPILQNPSVQIDIERIIGIPDSAPPPPPPAPQRHLVTRILAALRPRKLMRRSIKTLRQALWL